jgi:hypothetical protein
MPSASPGRPSRTLAEGRADAGGVAGTLRTLSGRVSRLTPDWRDPERFFEEKSELVGELRRLAQALDA